MGIKQITYTFSPSILNTIDPGVTVYNTTTGTSGTMSSMTWTAAVGNYTQQDIQKSLAAPKDAGTVTIDVAAQVWIYNYPNPTPTSFDTLTDTLTLKVETPTINSFQVSNDAGAGVAASPLWFGPTTGNPPTPSPSGTGDALTFMMAGGTPLARDWVGFWANVTNSTHYDLRIGTIQIVDFSIYTAYTDGSSYGASGTGKLDTLAVWPSYWYQDIKYRYDQGVTGSFTSGNLPTDSPHNSAPVSKGTGFLETTRFHAQFDTHLAVGGGWLPHGPGVAGYPIALSTAQWHLDGQAVNTANSTTPGAATAATTTNMANWVFSLAAGGGPSPATLPGPNGPWTAPGDGVPKYIAYDGNSYTSLGTLASEVELAQPDPGTASGGRAAYDLWDRAVALLGPVPSPVTLPESAVFDPQALPTQRKRPVRNGTDVVPLRETRPDLIEVPDRIGPLEPSDSRPIRLA